MGERNAGPSTTVAAATSAQDDRLNNMSTTTPMSTIATAEVSAARFAAQPLLVRRAAVLGAGTMGSRIAAHLANAGIPVLLLDMVPEGEGARNRLAQAALTALAKTKPAAFFEPSLAAMISPGNFEDDLPKLAQCDWVIEAVAENLEIKTALLERAAPHLAPLAVLTSNTSGLPIKQIAAGLKSHRDRFFGTHFFNPPRYMQLLEVIPTAESDRGAGVGVCGVCRSRCSASRWFMRTTRRTLLRTGSAFGRCSRRRR